VITRARAAFIFIFITVLLDMVAFGVIIPVLPQLIVTLEGGDTASAAGVFGIFGTAFAFMQFLSAPFLGALADRFGRRPVILLSNLGLGADYVVMALAPTIPILFVGRLISGITSSSFSTAGAYVADVTAPEKRAARFGMLGVAFGIGFIIGPALGGFLASIDLRAPFWAAATLSFANFLYGLLILPESLPRERRGRFSPKAANPIGALRFLGGHRGLVGLAGAAFFAYLAHDSLPVTFVLYAAHRFAFDERSIGLALALAGVSSLIVQGGVIGRVVAAVGEYRALSRDSSSASWGSSFSASRRRRRSSSPAFRCGRCSAWPPRRCRPSPRAPSSRPSRVSCRARSRACALLPRSSRRSSTRRPSRPRSDRSPASAYQVPLSC